MVDGFVVAVDWAKNGTFTDPRDDVTDRVRPGTRVTATYGRDQSTALSTTVAGSGSFALDNSSRDYSPRNTASPLFANLKPGRPVLITRTVTGTTYTILRARTDESPINPDLESKLVSFTLVDYLADLRDQKVSTPLYQGIRTGQAVGYVLDAVGWTGARDLDVGATVMPWWWEEGATAAEALQRILASEGPPALFTIDSATGGIIFRDRLHRLIRAASTTSQGTWRGDGAVEPVMGRGFRYDDAWQNIVNNASFGLDERTATAQRAQVWTTDELISLGASEARTVVVQASDPFTGATVPVAGVDYQILSGSLASVTLSRTSGASTSITLTATSSGCTIQGLALPAFPVPVARTWQINSSNAASKDPTTGYGQRDLPETWFPVWANRWDAQAIADLHVAQRAQPLPVLTVRFACYTGADARLVKVLPRKLSDRVTVVEPETGVSGDFYIESIAHSIGGTADHEITFGLEAVPAVAAGSWFVLGTSVLNGSDKLAY